MIYPAILSDSPDFVQQEMERFARLQPRPQAVQIDIIDGQFADEITVEAGLVRELETHGLPVDLHLMTVEPAQQLEEIWGNRQVRTVIGQIERMSSVADFLADVREGGWYSGLSLDIFTPVETLESESLEGVSVIQLMAGEAGKQGQALNDHVYDKIAQLKNLRQSLDLKFAIFVDIGVNNETAKKLWTAGADALVAGSYLQGDEAQSHWEALQKQG